MKKGDIIAINGWGQRYLLKDRWGDILYLIDLNGDSPRKTLANKKLVASVQRGGKEETEKIWKSPSLDSLKTLLWLAHGYSPHLSKQFDTRFLVRVDYGKTGKQILKAGHLPTNLYGNFIDKYSPVKRATTISLNLVNFTDKKWIGCEEYQSHFNAISGQATTLPECLAFNLNFPMIQKLFDIICFPYIPSDKSAFILNRTGTYEVWHALWTGHRFHGFHNLFLFSDILPES
jgi:hypothetical protein